MHKLRGLLYLTFRELWAKKVIVGLFVISTLLWVMFLLFMNVEEVEGGISAVRLFGGEVAVSGGPPPQAAPADTSALAGGGAARDSAAAGSMAGDSMAVDPEMSKGQQNSQNQGGGGTGISSFMQLAVITQTVVSQLAYWIVIVLALFSAAPLFSRLLEEGHVDLLLSKPMSRVTLFAGHVLGVLLMVLALATYLFGAVWLVLSIKLDVWNAGFLASILVLVGMFAVLYGVVALLTIWTESTALSLIVTYGIIFASLFLAARDPIYQALNQTGDAVFGVLYYVLPNYTEVGVVAARILHGESVQRWDAVGSTAVVGVLLYLGAAYWFTRRDF